MEPEEDPRQGLGCAAVTVIAILTAVPLALLWLWSRDAFIVTVWAVAWFALVYWARRPVPHTPNPSPPPPPDPSPNKKPQVSMMRDQSHPNRWVVTRPSRWLTDTHDKEG